MFATKIEMALLPPARQGGLMDARALSRAVQRKDEQA